MSYEERKKKAIRLIVIIVFVFIIIVILSIDLKNAQPNFNNPVCGNGFIDISEDCDDKIGSMGCPPNYTCQNCSCVREKYQVPTNGIPVKGDEETVNDENGNGMNEPDVNEGNGSGGGIEPSIAPPPSSPDNYEGTEPCSVSAEYTGTICSEENCVGELIGNCCIGVCLREGAGFTECFNTCVQGGQFSQAECEVLCSPS